MKKVFLFGFIFFTKIVFAYVPTVESLFRHASNPNVDTNGVNVVFSLKKMTPEVTPDGDGVEFFKIFLSKNDDSLRLAQTRYKDKSFSETSLQEKKVITALSSYTFKGQSEDIEKGLFYAVLKSILYNDGSLLVNYLKLRGIPVRLNRDIINKEKVELLAKYKQYLAAINKDSSLRKNLENPLRPINVMIKDKVEKTINSPMYVDLNQVSLIKENNEMVWKVIVGEFEASITDKMREIKSVKFKTELGQFEITCRDYWLGNGTHALPKVMTIKSFNGDMYQLDFLNLRHYAEKEIDWVKRNTKWDLILKNKDKDKDKDKDKGSEKDPMKVSPAFLI